jgi:hypothetical protein
LKNHFHLLVRIKEPPQNPGADAALSVKKNSKPSYAFANLFNAYAKAINIGYGRTAAYLRDGLDEYPWLMKPIFKT